MILNDSSLQNVNPKFPKENIRQNGQHAAQLIHMKNDDDTIKAECQMLISILQKQSRQRSLYQIPTQKHKNWEMMACHARNIKYTSKNVRTLKALQSCFQLICEQYLPYYKEIFNQQDERKRFELFLYDRIKAIRCQMYVQGIFDPVLSMKVIKLILFLETMMGQPTQLAGLQYYFVPSIKQALLGNQEKKKYYYEALQFAIFWLKKQKLLALLENNSDEIFGNQKLFDLLAKRTKIINNNYYVYLIELVKNENIFIRMILWTQIKTIRELILAHYKKAKMNEKAGFLCRVLGYSKMQGWVDISKESGMNELQKHKIQYDLQIKLWIPESKLYEVLDGFIDEK